MQNVLRVQNPLGPRPVRLLRSPPGLSAASLPIIISSIALLLSIGAFIASMYAVTSAGESSTQVTTYTPAAAQSLTQVQGQRDCLLLLGDSGELTCRKILASARHQVWSDGREPTPDCPRGYFSVATNANDHLFTPMSDGDSIVGFNLCAQSG